MDRAVANPVDTTGHEDDVMIIASEAPPPYPAETPTPQSADPTVPERMCEVSFRGHTFTYLLSAEDLETYVRDKPPRYGSVVLQVQNA